ncbi:MAG: hypothetical protein ABIQ40_10100, partial [Bacteroidia bacterium]
SSALFILYGFKGEYFNAIQTAFGDQNKYTLKPIPVKAFRHSLAYLFIKDCVLLITTRLS